MATLIRQKDWSATPLGPRQDWPQSLRTAVRLVLSTQHPMFIWWGADLIQLYNDAYRQTMGPEKHPHALGGKGRETWGEIWDTVGPQIESIMAGGEASWHEDQLVPVTRHGGRQDAWWTYSFSPIEDEGAPNGVGGVLVVCRDMTAQHLATEALRESEKQFRAFVTASSDVVYRMSPDWTRMHALNGRDFLPDTVTPRREWIKDYIHPDDQHTVWAEIEEAIRTRSHFEMEHRVRRLDGSLGWTLSRAVPILDEHGEITEWLGAAIDITARKQAEQALLAAKERQALLLELTDAIRTLSNPKDIQQAAMGLLGRHLGVSRAYYFDVVRDNGGWVHVIDDAWQREPNGPSMIGRHALKNFGDAMFEGFSRGELIAAADVGALLNVTPEQLASYRALGVTAFINVPLLRNGRYSAGIGAHDTQRRVWTEGDIDLIREVAARTWAAVERAAAEAALRDSELRLSQFGEASQDILWIRDTHALQWEYLTPAFERIYGLDRQEALAGDNYRTWLDRIVPEDRDRAVASIERVRAGELVTFEYRIRRATDGTIRWLRDTDFPITDAAGNVVLIGGIGHDFTEVREAERRLQVLVEGIPQLVWRAVDGHWTWSSPQWTDYTGQQKTQYGGWGWLSALHADDRANVRATWSRAIEQGGFQVEHRLKRHRDGAYRWFQTRAAAVRDQAGTIVEWLGTSTDIHELRELQERQKVLVAELQHRTRNLMGVVRSIGDKTLRSSADLSDFRTRFGDRLEALSRVQGLLSRMDDHDRVTFDELIGTELAAMNGSADRVTVDGPAGIRLRSSTVQTLALALHELATNAMKYGALSQASGRLAITWRLAPSDEDGRPWLHIDWRETGVTMPPAEAMLGGSGQGRELIERALPYQLSAKTTYDLKPNGAHCTISIPVSASTHDRLEN